jgi:hypothetical protein
MIIDLIGKAIRSHFAISPSPERPFLCDVHEKVDRKELFDDSPFVAIVMFVGLANKYGVSREDVESRLSIDSNQHKEFSKAFDDIMWRHHFRPDEYRVFEGNYEGNKKWNIARFHCKYKLCDIYIQDRTKTFIDKHKKQAPWMLKLRNLTFNGQKIPM